MANKRPEPLARAARVQRSAARSGFDWAEAGDPALWAKLHEEIRELKAVARDRVKAREELGDLLFAVVNVARHLRVDAGGALGAAIRKFERRYGFVIRHERSLPRKGNPRRLWAMERLWQEATRRERQRRV